MNPDDHWLRVCERSGACYAVAFVGTRIVASAPYARPILRRLGTHDVRVFAEAARKRGAELTLLRGHDGPCMLEV